MIIDGYNIKMIDYYVPKYYQYIEFDFDNMIINNYYPYYMSKDNQYVGDGTYMFEKMKFEDLIGTVDDPREGFVSTFISYGYNFTKEQYLEAYETNIIESSSGQMSLEVELDVNGHFKHITYSCDDYLVELTYTWNPNAVVDYSELDNYHIHTNECKEFIYDYSTYHRWYPDCGYSERSDFGVLQSCTFENGECIYCHHKKKEI